MTMTTGGVPEGIASDPPKMRDNRKKTPLNMHTPINIDLARLLRSIGKRENRVGVVYGDAFEDFLEGNAKCIVWQCLRSQPKGRSFRNRPIESTSLKACGGLVGLLFSRL